MKKTTCFLPTVVFVILLLFNETNAYADAAPSPVILVGGLLIIVGIIVIALALIAWLIIRYIRKRNKSET